MLILFLGKKFLVYCTCVHTQTLYLFVCVCLCVCMESVGVSLSKDYVFWRLLVMTPGQYLYVFANTGKVNKALLESCGVV